MSAINVLMLGWEYAPIVSGGLGIVCKALSQNLVKQGVKVTFVLPKIPRQMDVDYLDLVNASEITISEEVLQTIPIPSLLTSYANNLSYKDLLAMLRRKQTLGFDEEIYGTNLFDEVERFAYRAMSIAMKHPHDIIHAHDWMTFKAASNAKEVSHKPVIAHIHATEYDRTNDNPHPKIYEYERDGMEHADKIVAVSQKTKDKIVEHYGIHPDKVVVIHNAVDRIPEAKQLAHSIEKNDKIVLFLARLSMQKGADYLLKAAKKVVEVMDNVKFVFVGKGDMLEELINLSIDLGIAKNVVFTGFLPHDQVDRVYRYADLFVMPSISEPFGVTALEAVRNGTPVLMSKQSGASEVIRNCLTVDFWDVDEMANKILAVLHHSTLAETLTEKGMEELEHLTWEGQARKVIDLYRYLLP